MFRCVTAAVDGQIRPRRQPAQRSGDCTGRCACRFHILYCFTVVASHKLLTCHRDHLSWRVVCCHAAALSRWLAASRGEGCGAISWSAGAALRAAEQRWAFPVAVPGVDIELGSGKFLCGRRSALQPIGRGVHNPQRSCFRCPRVPLRRSLWLQRGIRRHRLAGMVYSGGTLCMCACVRVGAWLAWL